MDAKFSSLLLVHLVRLNLDKACKGRMVSLGPKLFLSVRTWGEV